VRREANNMPETRSRGWLVKANANALFDLTPIWERYHLEIRYMTWAVEKANPSRPRHVKAWFYFNNPQKKARLSEILGRCVCERLHVPFQDNLEWLARGDAYLLNDKGALPLPTGKSVAKNAFIMLIHEGLRVEYITRTRAHLAPIYLANAAALHRLEQLTLGTRLQGNFKKPQVLWIFGDTDAAEHDAYKFDSALCRAVDTSMRLCSV
jgi:hypothetical protein